MAAGHWNRQSRQWDLIGPPLRPCPADVERFEQAVRSHADGEPMHALLMGVTPEIARMRWPAGTRLTALDHSPGMVRGVWPGNPRIRAEAVCGEWLNMPIRHATFDLVIADGSFTLFRFPHQWHQAIDRICEVMAAGARLVVRFFVPGAGGESVAEVIDDLEAGRVGSFHVLKWRLAMALQSSSEAGVRVGDIFDAWKGLGLATGDIASHYGWPPAVIETINAYRGAEARYTFPSLDDILPLFEERFAECARHFGDYEMGERCPIMTLDSLP